MPASVEVNKELVNMPKVVENIDFLMVVEMDKKSVEVLGNGMHY